MRVRYHGSRTFGSLVAFYSDVTGKAFNFAYLLWPSVLNSHLKQSLSTMN